MNASLPQEDAVYSRFPVPPKHNFSGFQLRYSPFPCLCEAEQTALEYLGLASSKNFIHNDYMFCLTDSLW